MRSVLNLGANDGPLVWTVRAPLRRKFIGTENALACQAPPDIAQFSVVVAVRLVTARRVAMPSWIAESILSYPTFLSSLERLLKAPVEKTFDPTGHLLAVKAVGDWSVVNVSADRISVILDVTARIRIELEFKDPSSWTELEDDYDLKVLVIINQTSREVDVKVLTGVSIG